MVKLVKFKTWLKNKVAVITGGNSGIGFGIAKEFEKLDILVVHDGDALGNGTLGSLE